MKLTKEKLIKKCKTSLIDLGYYELRDTITGANGLFGRLVENDFFLTLGFTISRFHTNRFTADYYLSQTTLWGAVWGDIPQESYERVSKFLSKEERGLFLDKSYLNNGKIDGWWHGESEENFKNFLQVIKLTESRFLAQKDLFGKILNSSEIKELRELVDGVFYLVDKGSRYEMEFQFLPGKIIDGIPVEWFMASEAAIKSQGKILNKNTVKRLAADAWRQNILKTNPAFGSMVK